MKKQLLIILATLSMGLSGCTGLLIGGAVASVAAVVSTVHDRRTPGRVIDDRTLETKISKRLYEDKMVDSYSHTNLTIYNGVVLVTGEAVNQATIDRIINIVQTTPDVRRVESDLVVAPTSSLMSRTNDAAITSKVKTALLSLSIPNFDPTLINVSTERGNVYLMGLVTREEAAAITQQARIVSGVKSVTALFEFVQLRQ